MQSFLLSLNGLLQTVFEDMRYGAFKSLFYKTVQAGAQMPSGRLSPIFLNGWGNGGGLDSTKQDSNRTERVNT